MSFRKDHYKTLSKKVIESFEKRQMVGYYTQNKEEALKKALEIIEEGSIVSWGGSQSAVEIGLIDKIIEGNYKELDRSRGKTPKEVEEILKEAMSSDYYIMSSNAITQNGILLNVDGRGNRISALISGPKNIIIIAGMNKVVKDEEMALKRARSESAPINNVRIGTGNACTLDGSCHDCFSPRCICSNILTTRFSNIPQRIKIILVGEEIGY